MLDAALVCWVERYKALCIIDHSMCLGTDRQEMEPTDAEGWEVGKRHLAIRMLCAGYVSRSTGYW